MSLEAPGEEDRKQWKKNRRQVATRQANNEAKLEEVEKELEGRQIDRRSAPTNSLKLGVRELKKLAKDLKASISRATGWLAELDALIAGQMGMVHSKP